MYSFMRCVRYDLPSMAKTFTNLRFKSLVESSLRLMQTDTHQISSNLSTRCLQLTRIADLQSTNFASSQSYAIAFAKSCQMSFSLRNSAILCYTNNRSSAKLHSQTLEARTVGRMTRSQRTLRHKANSKTYMSLMLQCR